MKNKVNWFKTPQLIRQRGELYVNLMTSLVTTKVIKHIKKLTKKDERRI